MELHQIKSLLMIAREGNLTRAAERLHTSAPAVSVHIKALEEELGIELFHRSRRGMQLSAAGKALLPRAQALFDAARELTDQAMSFRGQPVGTLRLGIISSTRLLRLGELTKTLTADFPGLSIQARNALSGVVVRHLKEGDLDAGFSLGEVHDQGIESHTLTEVPLYVVIPYAWRERLARADWEVLAAEPWVWPPPECSFHIIQQDLFKGRGAAPGPRIEAGQETAIRDLVQGGAGLALLSGPEALPAAKRRQIALWGKPLRKVPLVFLTPREQHDDPAIRALRSAVSRTWNLGLEAP